MIITRRLINYNSFFLALTILLVCQVFQNDAFFLDKWDRLKKKWGLPSVFNGLGSGWGSGSSGLSFKENGKFAQGVRICINFAANFPQGYQQVSPLIHSLIYSVIHSHLIPTEHVLLL